jgi:predicted CXXCH cytochrome family protein
MMGIGGVDLKGIGLAALLLLLALLPACVDEQVVFRTGPTSRTRRTGPGASSGYSDWEAGRTVCGSCHVGREAGWSQTAHAGAWATLVAHGTPAASCEACHTVSEMGNHVQGPAGFVATGNPRYYDVQCEACHGPGFEHVTVPDAPGNQPLASLALGPNVDQGCAACHSGVHRPYAEEWAASRHGSMNPFPQGREGCVACHEGKGALRAWGVKSVFAPEDAAAPLGITCAVCHDPHSAGNGGQLRFPIDVPSVEQNLCMMCHSQRGSPPPASTQGPHAPEGPLLLGTAGWWPPNLEYSPGDILGTHGTERNPSLCAGCHVVDRQMDDPATGAFSFRTTGHTFEAIPCVDAQGVPTGERDCGVMERSFEGCTQCHSPQGARSAFIVANDRIDDLVRTIQPMLAQIPASEFGNPARYTTADGSRFNMQLAQFPGSAVHNPFLIEALLVASIRQIQIEYGISPGTAAVSLERQLTLP